MAFYPYSMTITKSVAGSLVAATGVQVSVFVSGSAIKKDLYTDSTGSTEIEQPLTSNSETGEVSFYCEPGRLRVEAKIDAATTNVYEIVITDSDIVGIFRPVTSSQRSTLATVTGMSVFNTTTNKIEFWDGTTWRSISYT